MFFEKKLERCGVRVPRGSILLTNGFNAPLANVPSLRSRSEVISTVGGPLQEPSYKKMQTQAIGEEASEQSQSSSEEEKKE